MRSFRAFPPAFGFPPLYPYFLGYYGPMPSPSVMLSFPPAPLHERIHPCIHQPSSGDHLHGGGLVRAALDVSVPVGREGDDPGRAVGDAEDREPLALPEHAAPPARHREPPALAAAARGRPAGRDPRRQHRVLAPFRPIDLIVHDSAAAAGEDPETDVPVASATRE
ncbi:hypothetical protein DL769_004388 [Monosporascus sp. CRB-8-3]|nr:hypothetical protein DL769_004388 [Monosporascus sp. CRB-8-3]